MPRDLPTGDFFTRDGFVTTIKTVVDAGILRSFILGDRKNTRTVRKGEQNDNVQHLKALYYDCDEETILAKLEQVGGAAFHEGYESCFLKEVDLSTGETHVRGEPLFDPHEVYRKS